MTALPPPPLVGPRFARALQTALELHWDQRRPLSDEPYVGHVLRVAGLVLAHGATEDEAIAALLHDGPERSGGRPVLDRIARDFGEPVADIVRACSDPLEGMVDDWRKRKEALVLHARKEAQPGALLVGAADKLDGLRTLAAALRQDAEGPWARLEGGKEGRLWYYGALVEAYRGARAEGRFPARGAPLLDDLERALTRVNSLAAGRRLL